MSSSGPSKENSTGTFIVEIKSRQHATWQGTLKVAGQSAAVPFRSSLELLKMMDSAFDGENNT